MLQALALKWRRILVGLALASTTLCIAQPTRAYRTAAELPEIPDGAIVRWSGAIELSLHRDQPEGWTRSEVTDALERAMQTWAAPSCAEVLWEPVVISEDAGASGDGKSVVQWSSDWDALELDATAPAVTDMHYEELNGEWHIVEADVLLNAQLFDESEGGLDVAAILTHELGHVLGLLHSCDLEDLAECSDDEAEATMYPGYGARQASLAADDIDGLCSLYGSVASGCQLGEEDDCDESSLPDASVAGECHQGDAGLCEADAGTDTVNGDFGESCSDSVDCVSGFCLSDSERSPVCSRQCSPPDDACPSGWKCRDVDQKRVCAPLDGGCGVVKAARGAARRAPLFLILATLVLMRTWRLPKRKANAL